MLKRVTQVANHAKCGFYVLYDIPNFPLHQHIGKESFKEIVFPHGGVADIRPDSAKRLLVLIRNIQ
jgi:hypothetical protein